MMDYQKERSKLADNILKKLDHHPKWPNDYEISSIDQKIKEEIDNGNFHQIFIFLKIKHDYYRGIHTTYDDTLNTLIRDARDQKKHYQCEASYYKYAQLGFNYLIGLIDLLSTQDKKNHNINKETVEKKLINYANQFYTDLIPTNANDQKKQKTAEQLAKAKFGRFFYTALLPLYRLHQPKLNDNQLKKELVLSRNFSNMKAPTYAVATLSHHPLLIERSHSTTEKKTMDVVELELPITELTEELKNYYQARKEKSWYIQQSTTAQRLIDFHIENILSKNKMIPAQLIYHLIGLRNAYEKWTVVFNKQTNQFNIINKAYHAASQAHLLELSNSVSKNERNKIQQDAVILTINQINELTQIDGCQNNLTINTLVTPLGINLDQKIAMQLKESIKQQNFVNTPLNTGRLLGQRNTKGIEKLLKIAEELLKKLPNEQHSYFQQIKETLSNNHCNTKLKKLKSQIIALYLCYTAVNSELKNYSSSFSDLNNHNLRLAARANLLIHALNQFQDQTKTNYVLISGCFSGQDRGGMLSTETTHQALLLHFFTNNFYSQIENYLYIQQMRIIRKIQARAGHTQEMAGNAGTGWGGEGIKPKSAGVIPHYYPEPAKKYLLSETGNYNEQIPSNPCCPFYQKKSFWINATLFIIGIALCATGILLIKGIIVLTIIISINKIAINSIALGIVFEAAAIEYYCDSQKKHLEKDYYPQLKARI